MTPPVIAELFALATDDGIVDVPVDDAIVRIRRDGEAIDGLVTSCITTRSAPPIREFLARVENECLDKPFRVRDVERVLDRVIDSALRVHA